jgi:hypothetical protein
MLWETWMIPYIYIRKVFNYSWKSIDRNQNSVLSQPHNTHTHGIEFVKPVAETGLREENNKIVVLSFVVIVISERCTKEEFNLS